MTSEETSEEFTQLERDLEMMQITHYLSLCAVCGKRILIVITDEEHTHRVHVGNRYADGPTMAERKVEIGDEQMVAHLANDHGAVL